MSARRRVRKRRPPVVAVLLAVVIAIGGLGVIGWEVYTTSRPSAPAANPGPVASDPADEGALLAESSPSPEPTGPRTRFADGIWTVGEDFKAGRYKTTVPADVFSCHWERMRDAKGTSTSTIEEGLGKPGTRVTVTIRATDKLFKSELCGTWSPA